MEKGHDSIFQQFTIGKFIDAKTHCDSWGSPGSLNQSNSLDASHRIYLGSGIYGEATLMFRLGSLQPNDYTYPDYRWPETLDYFGTLRSIYVEQLKFGRKC